MCIACEAARACSPYGVAAAVKTGKVKKIESKTEKKFKKRADSMLLLVLLLAVCMHVAVISARLDVQRMFRYGMFRCILNR